MNAIPDTVLDLMRGLKAGAFSATEVCEDYLERIHACQPLVNAFVHLDEESALADARRADRHLASGEKHLPLLGIPTGIKDIIDVAGMPTACNSRLLGNNMAVHDAAITRQLKAQGAVVCGKLTTHEFAAGLPSFDCLQPPARNPWNTEHHPGGSSSGCGSAVSSRMLPMAIGTDTGGSARHPASACGVVGFKPTYAALPMEGVFPLSPTLDHLGIVTTTALDAAYVFFSLADQDKAVALLASGGLSARDDLKGVRIGVVRHFHEEDMQADEAVSAALSSAQVLLGELGARVEEVRLPALRTFFAINRVILHSEAYAIHRPTLLSRPDAYGDATREAFLVGAFLRAEDYVRGLAAREWASRCINELFERHDVLLLASSMDPAGRFDDPVGTARTYVRQARTPFNVSGHPAVSVMAGLAANGLPVAVQFVARHHDETMLFIVAHAFEAHAGVANMPGLRAGGGL